MVDYNKLFIVNLKKYMTDQKMSQASLAKQSGISKSTITLIFKGNYNPSLSMMSKISETLNVPLSIFFSEDILLSGFEDKEKDKLKGYERIAVILPKPKAFMVKRWHEAAVKHIYGKKGLPLDLEAEFNSLVSSSNNETPEDNVDNASDETTDMDILATPELSNA